MPQDNKNPVKARAQEGLLSTIDELRMRLGKLVDEAFGQDDPEPDEPPEKAAADNIDELIKNAPPGLLMEELKRLSRKPEIVEMTQPEAD